MGAVGTNITERNLFVPLVEISLSTRSVVTSCFRSKCGGGGPMGCLGDKCGGGGCVSWAGVWNGGVFGCAFHMYACQDKDCSSHVYTAYVYPASHGNSPLIHFSLEAFAWENVIFRLGALP